MAFEELMDTRFQPAEDVIFEKQEGFVIVNDNRHGTIFGLDPNASFFWEALVNDLTPRQTVAQILSHCPATEEEVIRDLSDLLERWMELDLMVPNENPVPKTEAESG